ncbi:MAG: glutamate 5-kinase [Actinobacteria bacterium]|nr:glutamate 5-kinase [Actinomycetota bacterium]
MSTHIVVAKIGSSSVTTADGRVDNGAIETFCNGVAMLRAQGHTVVVVPSGAIAAGLTALGLGGDQRPGDAVTLQALASVGQSRLMATYERALADHGLVAGQVLLTPLDFGLREQYLQARSTLARLIELGVVPVVNENDATADDEIRFGDNDRLAALVAHLVGADTLVLLTDTAGLFTADPRLDAEATLIAAVNATDEDLDATVGGAGTSRGSGGMASKLAAARIAAFSGVRAVIAQASRPDVLTDAVAGEPGTGTFVLPRDVTLSARKLWIAFARPRRGALVIDAGAVRAVVDGNRSLLPAGVTEVRGNFAAGDAVEIVGPDDVVVAKGLVRVDSVTADAAVGHRTDDLDAATAGVVVHRDDLVVLVAGQG